MRDTVLVTGAAGQIGRAVCELLRQAGRHVVAIDVGSRLPPDVVLCDLRSKQEQALLFQRHPMQSVIHAAGILPGAFQSHPLEAADVNLSATLALMRLAVEAQVERFVFASSTSVYGTVPTGRAMTEDDPAAPGDAYGASKRAIELIGESLRAQTAFPFVALRIARVLGPGVRKSSSPWRSRIFDQPDEASPIRIPHSPDAVLPVVHVRDVARMLAILADAPSTKSAVYNTPVEVWTAAELKRSVEELRSIPVHLDEAGAGGGPLCDGTRFAQEFGYRLRGLRDYLSEAAAVSAT